MAVGGPGRNHPGGMIQMDDQPSPKKRGELGSRYIYIYYIYINIGAGFKCFKYVFFFTLTWGNDPI